jgi:hypothetical protein
MEGVDFRIINEKSLRDPSLDATDLSLAVSVMMFHMSEILIQTTMEEYSDNIDKIEEISQQKAKFSAQQARMSEEQIEAGLYIDDEGNLASRLDTEKTEDIPLPDIKDGAPVESSVQLNLTTSDGTVITIDIDFEFGYDEEKKDYYFTITNLDIANYTDGDGEIDAGWSALKDGEGGVLNQRVYANDVSSLSELVEEMLEKIQDELSEFTKDKSGDTEDDMSLFRASMKYAFTELTDVISDNIVAEIFSAGNAKGLESASMDGIFDVSSLSANGTAALGQSSFTIEFEMGGLTHYLDIVWEYDSSLESYTFDAYLRTDATPTAFTEALHIVKGHPAKIDEGQTEEDFFSELFDDLVGIAGNEIDKFSRDPKEYRDFWEDLYNLNFDHNGKWFDGYEDSKFKTRDGDYESAVISALGMGGSSYEGNENMGGIGEAGGRLGSALQDALGDATAPENVYQTADTEEAAANVSAGFYAPNVHGAILEEIMGPDIYQNGMAYKGEYWSDAIIPRLDDVILHLGSLNEIVMSKLKRQIETANAYLQMIITDLQKEFQAISSVFNS